MERRKPVQVGAMVGLCLCGALLQVPRLLLLMQPRRPPSARQTAMLTTGPQRHRSPADHLLWEARWWQLQARLQVAQEREALETGDPGAARGIPWKAWRRRELGRDQSGLLGRARAAAMRAAALTQNRDEAYRVAELRALLECEAGDHQAEFQQARLLMALAPRSKRSMAALRHAAGCLE